jgi:asparagine synthase (glutamine-hydrolysing)
MCGILGLINLNKNIEINLKSFKASMELLNHRGPDNMGIWSNSKITLGHRRLSIIDLSINGNQPIIDNKTGAVMIFNGMIYNYIELKKKLLALGYSFQGTSDTEVLFYSIIEWNEKAFNYLNGIWSLAIFFPSENKLLLSRDRFGVKPLYFINKQDQFAFSSEPKALLNLYPEFKEVNEDSLFNFFQNSEINSSKKSFYKNIYLFPPSSYGIYDLNKKKLNLHKYWEYPKKINDKINDHEAFEQFTNLFNNSVELRLRGDVPCALSLSGGLDSTAILTSINNINKKITCFTSVYEKDISRELYYAKEAISHTNSKLVTVLTKSNQWLENIKKIVWHLDGPSYSPAIIPHWNLLKEMKKKNFRVLLEGQGADELFAGYPQYYAINLIKNLNNKVFFNKLFASMKSFGLKTSLTWIVWEMLPYNIKLFYKKLKFRDKDYLNARERLIDDHSKNILPGLLNYGDALSMAHSIETRNPFLDYRLVEWAFKLPENLVFNNFETKSILRKYLSKNKQIKIANRNDKIGYNTPLNIWIQNDKFTIKKILLKNKKNLHKFTKNQDIENLIEKSIKGNVFSQNFLFKILTTHLWIEECIEKK